MTDEIQNRATISQSPLNFPDDSENNLEQASDSELQTIQALSDDLRKSKKSIYCEQQNLSTNLSEIKSNLESLKSEYDEKDNQVKRLKEQITKDQSKIMKEIGNLTITMKEKMETIDIKPPSVVSRTSVTKLFYILFFCQILGIRTLPALFRDKFFDN